MLFKAIPSPSYFEIWTADITLLMNRFNIWIWINN